MLYAKAVIPGVAASILFWLLDRGMLSLAPTHRILGMLTCLVVFTIISVVLLRRADAKRVEIGSRQQTGGDLDASLDRATLNREADAEIFSRNKTTGNANISIGTIETK